ncbi:hypothetical protein ACFQ2B_13925 [Streptomyces stramineus]
MTHLNNGAYQSQGHRRASRAKRWTIVVASIAVLGLIAAGCSTTSRSARSPTRASP